MIQRGLRPDSQYWVEVEFCEVRIHGVLRSSLPAIGTWLTKIRHMADVASPSCLLEWWRCRTQDGAEESRPSMEGECKKGCKKCRGGKGGRCYWQRSR